MIDTVMNHIITAGLDDNEVHRYLQQELKGLSDKDKEDVVAIVTEYLNHLSVGQAVLWNVSDHDVTRFLERDEAKAETKPKPF